ncbi:MAG: hypothetical protein JW929_15895 [Anaerolineales bacterium]|nr:hypothetical protein [Anaerolineales bacterium]
MAEQKPINLRPLLFAELLDRTFRIYRGNFLRLVGILALMEIPLQLITLAFNLFNSASFLEEQSPSAYLLNSGDAVSSSWNLLFRTISGTCLIGLVSLILLQAFANGALTKAVFHAALGEPLGIREAYRGILPLLPRLILTALLGAVIIVALGIWMIVPCFGWITGFGLLLYFSWVLQSLVIPVVVMERKIGLAAFRRAWDLARRRFWWVLGFVGALILISTLVTVGPTYLVSGLINLAAEAFSLTETQGFVLRTAVSALVGLIGTLLFTPLAQTGFVLLYLDLRARTEGLDLAMRMRDPGESAEAKMQALAEVQGAGPASLLTWKEFGYFVLLSIGAFLIILTVYLLLVLIGVAMVLAIDSLIPSLLYFP